MAALTCIRNPSDEKETLIFFTTADNQVGYDIRDEASLDAKVGGGTDKDIGRGSAEDGKRVPTFGAGSGKEVGGLVRHPGAFQALAFKNLIKVYGITKSNIICEVSPGVRDLPQKLRTNSGGLTGCGNGKDLAWLYYLSTAETPQLKQFQLATGANVSVQGPPTPDQESCLSAWYKELDGSHGVVYQHNDNTNLKYWEVKSDGSQSNSEVTNSTQAAKKTPITTVVKGDKVYLYFISSSNALIRAERTGSGGWTNQKADSSNDWSLNPITSTLSLNGKYIIIRQQYSEDDGYLEFPDKRDIQ